jgi:hypothetical protein
VLILPPAIRAAVAPGVAGALRTSLEEELFQKKTCNLYLDLLQRGHLGVKKALVPTSLIHCNKSIESENTSF